MSTIPDGVKKPQDRKTPAQAEVEGGTAEIVWGEHAFTVPADMDDLPGEFIAAAEKQAASQMIAVCLGAKQYRDFMAAKPKVRDMKSVGDQIAELYGFGDAGN